uniref:alpha/beta fold hydrolase n=1 Tax=Acetatifactor sp. TaxID=1872090 RepID=UPI004056E453
MRKEEFYFDSRSGADKIHAVRYTPEHGQVRGVVQIVHGMAEYAERYEALAQFLTDKGFVVTGDDHLGHGKSVAEGGVYGYFCKQDPATVVVRDVHRLKKMTQKEYPTVPYVILGHSMGSFILRNYMCRYGTGINGAIIVGTGMQSDALLKLSKGIARVQRLFCGDKHVSKYMDKVAFGSYNDKIENAVTDKDWLTKDAACVERYIADPLCGFTFTVNGFATLFELMARAQKKENLEKIPTELPVYVVSGTEDPVGNYGIGVRKVVEALEAIGLQDVSLKLYDTDRHEVLNETDKAVVMQDIYDWIENKILV